MPNNKSSALDGYHAEFCSYFWSLISPVFLQVIILKYLTIFLAHEYTFLYISDVL